MTRPIRAAELLAGDVVGSAQLQPVLVAADLSGPCLISVVDGVPIQARVLDLAGDGLVSPGRDSRSSGFAGAGPKEGACTLPVRIESRRWKRQRRRAVYNLVAMVAVWNSPAHFLACFES